MLNCVIGRRAAAGTYLASILAACLPMPAARAAERGYAAAAGRTDDRADHGGPGLDRAAGP